ncbi:sensor histidine kinase [Conexibacter stalactiti]|uniref:histidine kinase n=1 Tax=Conexibacter stalactiti TaxID=1940611 RepID=A0ABU4HMH1_9ACTN|nr:sensor histidine kinase [Conexibacter stalactiti]MDW5594497.1 sensor histidine kinase [Conexibacter stalactiti]MEC5035139.1 sensor histidine kinase [Conexibacter stalactiti]
MTGLLANPTFQRWLPVIVLPPILLLDGLLSTKPGTDPSLFDVLCAYVAVLPLALRERLGFFAMAPFLVAGAVLVLWAFEPGTTVVLIPAWALFDMARERGRRQTIIAAVLIVPCVMLSVLPFCDDGGEFVSITLRNLALCELALAAGYLMWHNRAALQREVSAREADAERRLGDERLRIAREVHDVVAHAIVGINVQAGVAAHIGDENPAQVREALLHIKRTSGEALTDLRATLGILRDTEQAAPVEPSTGLADLDDVAAQLRATGVRVEVDVDRDAPVSTPVHAASYRIVQEALTNVLRHADARSVRVVARAEEERLRIVVDDDGNGSSTVTSGAGAGLRGMRERAEALGGTLTAGPGAERGWRVEATLPRERP